MTIAGKFQFMEKKFQHIALGKESWKDALVVERTNIAISP